MGANTIIAPTASGAAVNKLIIQQHMSPEDAIKQVLGNLEQQLTIPEGSKVVNSSLNYVEYVDPQGHTHKVQRNGDATSADFGRFNDSTDAPNVPSTAQSDPNLANSLQQAIATVTGQLAHPSLPALSDSDQNYLNTISNSGLQQMGQQFTREGGDLVNQLYGRGVNQSTVANDAVAQLSQAHAIATNDWLSKMANQSLGLKQFLAQLQTGAGVNVLQTLSQQDTQRAIAEGQLTLGGRQLDEQSAEAARNFMLNFNQFQNQIAQQKKQSTLGLLSGIASLGGSILGIPGVGAGLGSLLGLGGAQQGGSTAGVNSPAPPVPKYFPSTSTFPS